MTDDRDVRGGHDCLDHQWVDPSHCGICHERKPMREVAVVFDKEGQALYWLDGVSGCAVPDSRSLWDIVWENRANLGGVAHTHPWEGETSPSGTDLTTFEAIESGLGKKLIWPIVTLSHVFYYGVSTNPIGMYYLELFPPIQLDNSTWLNVVLELRRRSRGETHG